MSLRAGALLLGGVLISLSAAGCGGNADEIPIPEAGTGDPGEVDAGMTPDSDEPDPTPDADEPEPDGEPPPPSACPVFKPIRVTDAPGVSEQPAIHWNGTSYLVVWADARAGGSDIYATWLTREGGRVAGATDLLIADTAQQATSPEIVPLPSGQGYLVVYENCFGTGLDVCTIGSVESIVLGADGRPGGQPPVTISPMAAEQRRPYVATGHSNVYITFRDRVAASGATPAHTVARLGRLDATGALVEPVRTFDEASDGHYPYVAVSPDRVALVYQRNKPTPEIVLALLDPALTLEKELVVRPGFDAPATNPVVQWNVSRWVLAWEDEREGDEPAIYATTAAADGSQVETPQRAYDENGNWPAIASGGKMTSLIGFYGFPGQRIFLARLESTGRLKPGQVVIDDVGRFPAVVYNEGADEYAVIYQNERLDEVMFVRFKCAD
jgi:hypothetical protein